MARPVGPTLAEDCRYLLAELIRQGYTLDEIAEGCRDDVELIRNVWLSNGYHELGERLYLDLDSLVRHNHFLPKIRKLIHDGQHLQQKMGEAVWADPTQREEWLKQHAE